MLIYDCEIARAIPGQDPTAGYVKRTGSDGRVFRKAVEYCAGWRDFAGMGIACIVAVEFGLDRYHVFMRDNLHKFQDLVDSHDVIVGYNALAFDNQLCAANGIQVDDGKTYDLLVEIWKAAGLAPTYQGDTHKGFGLGAVCQANLYTGKSGDGAAAPLWFQAGWIGRMIDYCMDDVWLTKRLFWLMLNGYVVDPRPGATARLPIVIPDRVKNDIKRGG